MKDAVVFNLQYALFFLDILRNPNEIHKIILNEGKEILEEEIRLVDLPENDDLSIFKPVALKKPFVTSFDRIDFYFSYSKINRNILDRFIGKFDKLLDLVMNYRQLGRVGIISNMFYQFEDNEDKNSVKYIAKNFFKDKSFEDSYEISFRINTPIKIEEHHINNINTFEPAVDAYVFEEHQFGVVKTKDINCSMSNIALKKDFICKVKDYFLSEITKDQRL